MARRRHLSRIAVMQVLFERERRANVDPEAALKMNHDELGEMDDAFAKELLEGVLKNEDMLKQTQRYDYEDMILNVIRALKEEDWLLSTLQERYQIGSYELLVSKDAPPAVVMNEAIDIAKEFGTDESGKFVNGVLNAVANGSKPA